MSQIEVELLSHFGTDRDIAEAAWTSSNLRSKAKKKTDAEVERLIKLLANEGHSVPFRHTYLKFWFKIPIAVDRQIVKHAVGTAHCLSGSTMLWFDSPHSKTENRPKLIKMTIAEFYRKWQKSHLVKRVRPNAKKDNTHKHQYKRMLLRQCDENTGEITNTTITDVIFNGQRDVFKVTFSDGYSISCTLNHKFLTENGWKTLADALQIDSTLTSTPLRFNTNERFSANGIPDHQNKEILEKYRNQGMSVQEIANAVQVSYHTIRKWLKKHGLQFSREETYFKKESTPWNKGLNYKSKVPYVLTEKRIKQFEKMRGENSAFWKGGISDEIKLERTRVSTTLAPQVFKRDNYTCVNCGANQNLNAHHIIPVYVDSSKIADIDNLITLCKPCHMHLHSNNLELEFAKNMKMEYTPIPKKKSNIRGKKRDYKKLLRRKFVNVISIEYQGKEDTYDLSVAGEFKNFVADGLIVHNSGMSGRYRTMPAEYLSLPDDVVSILRKSDDKSSILEYAYACDFANAAYISIVSCLKKQEADGILTNAELKRAREFVRGMLPQHNMTETVMSFNLQSFANFMRLRAKPNAQPEIQLVATKMLELTKAANFCPISIAYLENNGWKL